MRKLERSLFNLIQRTSTDLPRDVDKALENLKRKLNNDSVSAWVIDSILRNIEIARMKKRPICQDTGGLTFFFRIPPGTDTNIIISATHKAVSEATNVGILRKNILDPLTGKEFETNIGDGHPCIIFQQGALRKIEAWLIIKGGGSENACKQYQLPDEEINADRSIQGIKKCILYTIWNAQGIGCPPYIVTVCIGGDRSLGYMITKQLLLKKIGTRSKIKILANLENEIYEEANSLNIGPMGMGGNFTVLDVKIATQGRVPASFFVTVSLMCWAFRRRGIRLSSEGEIERWA